MSGRGRLRRATGEKTREKILEAAEEIFVRYGYEGARMEQIAERAGVRKANIYYYFPGKDQLYQALVDRTLGALISGIRDFLERPAESPWDQIDQFLDLFFRLIDRYRGLIGLAYGELLHPPREDVQTTIRGLLDQIEELGAAMIQQGVDRGDFRPQDPMHTILTLEGALFHYFLVPEDRIVARTGKPRFDPENLRARRQHLSTLFRRILGRDEDARPG